MMLYIQQRSCPACRNAHMVDFERWGSHCFNCGQTWQAPSSEFAHRVVPADDWLREFVSEAGMGMPVTA